MHARLLILLVASDQSEWVEGLRRALSEALDAKVRLEVVAEAGPHELELRLARPAPPGTTVVAVDFPKAPLDARVRLRSKPAMVERHLTFQLHDAPLERGRALGFFVSSMVPELRADYVAQAPPPKPPRHNEPAEEPPAAPAPAPDPAPANERPAPEPAPHERAEATPAPAVPNLPPAPIPPPSVSAPAVEEHPEAWRISVGATALGAWSGSPALPEGGMRATAQLHLGRFGVRAGGLFRLGAVPQADAISVWAGPFAGGAVVLLEGHLTLTLRVDLAALWLQVSRPTESRSRWLATFQPRLEADVALTRWLWVEVAAGADLTPSPTEVYVDGALVAELPQASGALELGLKAAF
jgi:hypothetical protein